jgi:uncharacterized membrane protein
LPGEYPTPKVRGGNGKAVGLAVAVVGVVLLAIGLALCFMSVEESYSYYGMPIYYATYPYRAEGASMIVIGAIILIVGFGRFATSKYRDA